MQLITSTANKTYRKTSFHLQYPREEKQWEGNEDGAQS